MSEADFKEIGVVSFGARRKLSLAITKMKASEVSIPLDPQVPVSTESEASDCSFSGSQASSLDESIGDTSALSCSISSPQVPERDNVVKATLKEHTEGRELVKRLESGKSLNTQQRRLFVRIQVGGLTKRHGLYPTSVQKTRLARDIVTSYPSLKDTTDGMEGHEIFYHQGEGFIEYRLKTVRARESGSKRKRETAPTPAKASKPDETCDPATDSITMGHVQEMKYTPPSKDNSSRIHDLFKQTHDYRRKWATANLIDSTSFIKEYPRLQDMPELINLEFQLMFPDQHKNFLVKWDTFYAKRVLTLARQESQAISSVVKNFEDGDETLCSIISLTHMLYRSGSSKGKSATSRVDSLKFLLQNVQIGTDLGEHARKKDPKFQQPYLLCLGQATKPAQYAIVLDNLSIPAGGSIVPAIDRLFKTYYCFNVEFPPAVAPFWEFLSFEIYNVISAKTTKPNVRSLATTIRELTL